MKAKLLRPIFPEFTGQEVQLLRPMMKKEKETQFTQVYWGKAWWWTRCCGAWARPTDTKQMHLESEMEIIPEEDIQGEYLVCPKCGWGKAG